MDNEFERVIREAGLDFDAHVTSALSVFGTTFVYRVEYSIRNTAVRTIHLEMTEGDSPDNFVYEIARSERIPSSWIKVVSYSRT